MPQRPLQWFRPALEAVEKIAENNIKTYMTYFNDAKRRSEAGVAKNCLATHSLSEHGNQRMSDLEIAYTLSTPFRAGVETVRRFLSSYLSASTN